MTKQQHASLLICLGPISYSEVFGAFRPQSLVESGPESGILNTDPLDDFFCLPIRICASGGQGALVKTSP